MSSLTIALIIFACIFGSALLGQRLRAALPEHHLSADAKDVVKLATGLIATMSALVLGLLISTAKGSFDRINSELVQGAAAVLQLDRALAATGAILLLLEMDRPLDGLIRISSVPLRDALAHLGQ